MEAEGWYRDPFELHEARWFSTGTPTSLVRDGSQVTHDAPPSEPLPGPLVPWDGGATAQNADDLLRADALQEGGGDDGGTGEQMDKVSRVVFNTGDTDVW